MELISYAGNWVYWDCCLVIPADWISISYVGPLDEGKVLGLVRGYTVEELILVGRRVSSVFMYKFHEDSFPSL